MELSELLDSLRPDSAGGFSTDVPGGWGQGRTLYGGINAALAARSARQLDGNLGPLRALQIAFMAPLTDHVRYLPTLLRQGRSVSFVGVDCFGESGLATRAILTYGRPRESALTGARLSAPPVPAPEDCRELELMPGTPTFLSHVDVRFAAGSAPQSGGEPDFAMWVRHRNPVGVDAESGVVAVADVLPPAVLASTSELRPASSVTWTVDFVESLPDPGGWYLLRTSSDHVADGYSLAAPSCFDAMGRLVAVGRQTVAVF